MTAAELDQQILELISKGLDYIVSDDDFNRLALAIFHHQFEQNEPYRNYCSSLSVTPEKINHWKEIPAVPSNAFKYARLASFSDEKTIKVFHTSGTTQSKSGMHYLDTEALYKASLKDNFKRHLLPEYKRIPILSLTPSAQESPHSSLVFMLDECMQLFSSIEKAFFIRNDQIDIDAFTAAMREYEKSQEPILLAGTAFSFVHWFDYCREKQLQFHLNPQSRIMETGGFKGKSREVTKAELYNAIEWMFGIPQKHIINEYGMTELGTQFYDNKLVSSSPKNYKTIPPWSRIQIIDPETGKEIQKNEAGLIRIYDLSNRGSVIAIQTEDIGIRVEDGFDILGRNPKATPRGCSIGIDEILS